jgi:DNA-binding NarL/FixJ family response regulator
MTGSDNTLVRKKAMQLGCIAYLQKPFPASELEVAISEAIG